MIHASGAVLLDRAASIFDLTSRFSAGRDLRIPSCLLPISPGQVTQSKRGRTAARPVACLPEAWRRERLRDFAVCPFRGLFDQEFARWRSASLCRSARCARRRSGLRRPTTTTKVDIAASIRTRRHDRSEGGPGRRLRCLRQARSDKDGTLDAKELKGRVSEPTSRSSTRTTTAPSTRRNTLPPSRRSSRPLTRTTTAPSTLGIGHPPVRPWSI